MKNPYSGLDFKTLGAQSFQFLSSLEAPLIFIPFLSPTFLGSIHQSLILSSRQLLLTEGGILVRTAAPSPGPRGERGGGGRERGGREMAKNEEEEEREERRSVVREWRRSRLRCSTRTFFPPLFLT